MPPPTSNKKYMELDESVPYTKYLDPEDPADIFSKLEKPTKLELEPRPTFLKVGAISTIKGSAYMEYGNTKMMVNIVPPRELNIKQIKKGSAVLGIINCIVKYAPFSVRDIDTIPAKESFLSTALKKALEPMICRHEFPNFQLDVNVMVLDDDGCVLSTAINCCGAALVEGGIPTYDLITASTVCLYKQVEFVNPNGIVEELISNISEEDAEEEHGIVVTASLPNIDQVAECCQKGYLTYETLARLSEHTLTINQRMLDIVRQVLVSKVKEHLHKKSEEQTTKASASASNSTSNAHTSTTKE